MGKHNVYNFYISGSLQQKFMTFSGVSMVQAKYDMVGRYSWSCFFDLKQTVWGFD